MSRVIRAYGREIGNVHSKTSESNDVSCSDGDFGRFLKSRPKFSLVGQSTRGTGPKYSETPWTLPLIAAHRWLKHDMSRLIRAYGREIG
jgi:hypothetical protein